MNVDRDDKDGWAAMDLFEREFGWYLWWCQETGRRPFGVEEFHAKVERIDRRCSDKRKLRHRVLRALWADQSTVDCKMGIAPVDIGEFLDMFRTTVPS